MKLGSKLGFGALSRPATNTTGSNISTDSRVCWVIPTAEVKTLTAENRKWSVLQWCWSQTNCDHLLCVVTVPQWWFHTDTHLMKCAFGGTGTGTGAGAIAEQAGLLFLSSTWLSRLFCWSPTAFCNCESKPPPVADAACSSSLAWAGLPSESRLWRPPLDRGQEIDRNDATHLGSVWTNNGSEWMDQATPPNFEGQY